MLVFIIKSVTICLLLLVINSQATCDPPEPGFTFDAQPRIVRETVTIKVVNANLAHGGVQTLAIVGLTGIVIQDLRARVQGVPGQQDITVETSNWPRGMYFVVGSDASNSGLVKLLKIE